MHDNFRDKHKESYIKHMGTHEDSRKTHDALRQKKLEEKRALEKQWEEDGVDLKARVAYRRNEAEEQLKNSKERLKELQKER